jgi:hypothetical protein
MPPDPHVTAAGGGAGAVEQALYRIDCVLGANETNPPEVSPC